MAKKVKSAKKRAAAKATKPTKKSAAPADHALLAARLRAIEEVHAPVIPVDRLIGEARAVARAATADRDALVQVGLDWALATLLPQAATALSDAQVEMLQVVRTQRSTREVELEQAGIALRSAMIADVRFARRDDADVQATLDTIVEGEGLDDEIQDLRELAALFKTHAAALKRVGADPAGKARKATAVADELEGLLAERRSRGSRHGKEPIEARDRAATLVNKLLREIRAAGVYAFRKDPARQARYRSAYQAQKRARPKRKASQPNGAIVTPPASTGPS
jgi:hypothetical protein